MKTINNNKALINARTTDSFIFPNGSTVPNYKYTGGVNSNWAVVGSSGTYKTRGCVLPNILAGAGGASIISSETKNALFLETADQLEKMGYKIYRLDFAEPEKSHHCFNPFPVNGSPDEIQKFSYMIANMDSPYKEDPFWNKSETLLLNACTGYITEGGRGFAPTLQGVLDLASKFDAGANENGIETQTDLLFKKHRDTYKSKTGKESWAYGQYERFKGLSQRTFSCILMTLYSDLAALETSEMRKMMSRSSFDVLDLAREKCALFINVSDTDRSKDLAVNLFYTQAMDKLCRYADSLPEKRLPVPVRFILDDFGTSSKIVGFDNMISNIRSRGISAMLILQSLAQLEKGYGESASTIISNCATKIYMGGCDLATAQYFSKLSNKPLEKIINMPLKTHLTVRQSMTSNFAATIDVSEYSLDTEIDIDTDTSI